MLVHKGPWQFLSVGLAVMGLGLAPVGGAAAQWADDFESSIYQGSAQGVPLDGQDGWYGPSGASDFLVFTYDGNALGLPPNPNGGDQFIGQVAPGDGSVPRAQHDWDFSSSSSWTVSYDMCAGYLGSDTAPKAISGFSLQPAGSAAYFVQVNYWQNTAGRGGPSGRGVRWRAAFDAFDVFGDPMRVVIRGKPARELQTNRWYNIQITFDLNLNQVMQIVYTDLANGNMLIAQPLQVYLAGGSFGGLAPPTGFRFVVGDGTNPGNAVGFDNLTITPGGPGPVPGHAVHGEVKARPVTKSTAEDGRD